MLTPNFSTKKTISEGNYEQFTLEPLAPSFGQTFGNALRRTLLSSLNGSAAVAVKIDGVAHLFNTLKGVKETALEIMLNIKQVKFKSCGEGTFKVSISQKGIGKIYAKDIEGECEVVDGEVYIAEITDPKSKLDIEILVEEGSGYVLAEEQQTKEFGFISIDSSFSPVKKVNFKIEDARVGRKTNYDRLILDVYTDGSITPEKAVAQSAKILSDQFNHIFAVNANEADSATTSTGTAASATEIDKKFYDLIIDELNLPSRVVNALLRENIETVADLIKTGEDKLVAYKGLGKKSIELIKEELKKLGVQWHS